MNSLKYLPKIGTAGARLDTWSNDKFLGEPCEHGDDRGLTSYILGCSEYYVDNQERA
jgi:hypothetical protein